MSDPEIVEPKIPSGMQGMMKSIVKMLGLDPAKIEAQIREFVTIMLNIDSRLDEIKAQQAEILSLLKQGKKEND